jgi:hypothetical protein
MESVFFPTSFEANIKFDNQEIFLVLVKPLAFLSVLRAQPIVMLFCSPADCLVSADKFSTPLRKEDSDNFSKYFFLVISHVKKS